MSFDLVCQQVQHLLIKLARILADVQIVVVTGLETGDELALLKYFYFTAFAIVMQVFTNFKMVNLLV